LKPPLSVAEIAAWQEYYRGGVNCRRWDRRC
jgi:hypothetical protein